MQAFEKPEYKEAQISPQGIARIDGGKVFCELLGSEKKFVICGGGHVSIPVIQMGLMLGFHITVLEDRSKFADYARRAGAHEIICDSFEEGLEVPCLYRDDRKQAACEKGERSSY